MEPILLCLHSWLYVYQRNYDKFYLVINTSGLRPWTCMCMSSCVFYDSVWHYKQCISRMTVKLRKTCHDHHVIKLCSYWILCQLTLWFHYFILVLLESVSSYLTCLSLQPVLIYLCVTCETARTNIMSP